MQINSKRNILISIIVLILCPVIIFVGSYFGDNNYSFVSMILVVLIMIPFFMVFEGRRPRTREVVPIAVLCAIAVCGRLAFVAVPQFKPVAAIVIITGITLGKEAGFVTGAISALASNIFFGQGPWTPWQMFAFGIIGFIAGLLYNEFKMLRTKTEICIFGVFAGYLYGLILNTWTILSAVRPLNLKGAMAIYVSGFPFDTIHAVSTAIFLFIIAKPMIEKLLRVKDKYGLLR